MSNVIKFTKQFLKKEFKKSLKEHLLKVPSINNSSTRDALFSCLPLEMFSRGRSAVSDIELVLSQLNSFDNQTEDSYLLQLADSLKYYFKGFSSYQYLIEDIESFKKENYNRQFTNAILALPNINDMSMRDSLLQGLPGHCLSRSNIPRVDITNLVNALERTGNSLSGESFLEILAKNCLEYSENLQKTNQVLSKTDNIEKAMSLLQDELDVTDSLDKVRKIKEAFLMLKSINT